MANVKSISYKVKPEARRRQHARATIVRTNARREQEDKFVKGPNPNPLKVRTIPGHRAFVRFVIYSAISRGK